MKKTLLLFGLMVFVFVGCSENHKSDKKLAEEYVNAQGYEVESDGSAIRNYTLDKSKMQKGLDTLQYRQIWSVQENEPAEYFGEEISTFCFVVNNHPLKKIFNVNTNVYVMVSNGKVIGGYSFPAKELYGSVYSIDGRTLEEITGSSYEEWSNNWTNKYDN